MSKSMPSAPRKPPAENSVPVGALDLDARIALAEQAVIVRDARIRRRADALVHRVKRDAVRHAGSGLLVGIATIGLAWWLKRRDPAPPAAPAAATAAPPPGAETEHLLRDAGITLAGLLPLIWPMLPRSLRRSVTPGTASTVLSFFAPLVARLFRRKPRDTAFP
jgi:hypothetical protein